MSCLFTNGSYSGGNVPLHEIIFFLNKPDSMDVFELNCNIILKSEYWRVGLVKAENEGYEMVLGHGKGSRLGALASQVGTSWPLMRLLLRHRDQLHKYYERMEQERYNNTYGVDEDAFADDIDDDAFADDTDDDASADDTDDTKLLLQQDDSSVMSVVAVAVDALKQLILAPVAALTLLASCASSVADQSVIDQGSLSSSITITIIHSSISLSSFTTTIIIITTTLSR